MVTWKDFYVESQRRQDEIDRTQLYNAVQPILEVAPRERFYQRGLAALGVLLENWGRALQTRYATLIVGSYQIEDHPCPPRCSPAVWG